MTNWLKAFGSSAKPLPDDWTQIAVLQNHATFAMRPSVAKGDRIIYYAASYGVIFAAGLVISQPYQDPTNSNGYVWRVDVELEIQKNYLHEGARIEKLTTATSPTNVNVRVKRRSHVRLTDAEYDAAVAALNEP